MELKYIEANSRKDFKIKGFDLNIKDILSNIALLTSDAERLGCLQLVS